MRNVLRGPGLFFVLPCTDIYEIIDMRVCFSIQLRPLYFMFNIGAKFFGPSPRDDHQGQRYCLRQCHHVLQGECATTVTTPHHTGGGPGEGGDQRGRLQRLSAGSGGNHPEESYKVAASLRIFENVDSPSLIFLHRNVLGTRSLGEILSDRVSWHQNRSIRTVNGDVHH